MTAADIAMFKRYWRPRLMAAGWAMWLFERRQFALADAVMKSIYVYDTLWVRLFPKKKT